ncbi:MAG: hypothetical protein E7326_09060, partial [Clostridiales bacterium]|nr:hypothetical protein [Clostridiales bacterium]
MRKILGAWLLFLMLLPVCALAEAEVWTDSEKIVLGEWICAGADVGENETVVYSMYRDGEMLFEGLPTTAGEGWYQPDEAGAYTLKAVLTDASGAVREAKKSFEVCEVPVCQLLCDRERIAFGESVHLTAQVTGGTGDFTYECTVIVGNACVDRVITGEPEFSVTPAGKGQVLLHLTVTDKGGHACTAEYALTVEDAPGIGISGDTGAFHGGGGMRLWQIEAPGVWQAETDAAFVTLHSACGVNGDQLAFSVEENNGKMPREGEITLRAGNLTRVVTVYQSNTFPMEREEYMDRVTDVIFVEGETLHAWSNAEGRKTFRVESNGPWTAVCDQPFVSLNLLDGELEAVLESNDT